MSITRQTFARIARKIRGTAASDGAGVKLTRVIGRAGMPALDPFLLLDELGTARAEDDIAGFPSHLRYGWPQAQNARG